MEIALPGILPQEAPVDGMLVLVVRLLRQAARRAAGSWQRVRQSTADEEFLGRVESATERFGRHLLTAQDRDDLRDRVDAVIEDPEFHATLFGLVRRSLDKPGGLEDPLAQEPQLSELSEVEEPLRKVCGPASARAIHQGTRYMAEVLRVLHLYTRQPGVQEALRSEPGLQAAQSLAWEIVYNPDIPPQLARGVLAGQRMGALELAMLAALVRGEPLAPWLGLAVAERWLEEAREYLRLLVALTPGAVVSEELLPAEERLDVEALSLSMQQASRAFRELVEAAERAGEPIYPPEA